MRARTFGLKDVFTTINLLGGAVAVFLCVAGEPFWAGLSVMTGYMLGDTLDGWVARKLNSANRFGAEYDTIADHTAHCLAPGAIVFTAYRDAGLFAEPWANVALAGVLGAAIMVAASIRHARNVVKPVEFQGVWAGVPRSVLGFVSICYVNASLAPHVAGGMWVGAALILLLCVGTLTHLPFPNHHLPRGHFWYVRALIVAFFVTTFGTFAVAPRFVFDVLFFWQLGYLLTGWMSLKRDERRAFSEAVRVALERTA